MGARHGPSHPLALAAVAALLVNDHVLKGVGPGWFTGKASDVAWLVVAPVVLASALARLGASERVARGLGLVVPAVSFVALQLWPPLGDAWVALVGGAHVADAEDLLALPALLLVPWCWGPRRRATPGVVALPVAALALVATSYDEIPDLRSPCPDATWDPNAPLVLLFDTIFYREPPVASANFRDGITLRDAAGRPVPYQLAVSAEDGAVHICPIGGLEPGATYTWTVRFRDPHPTHAPAPDFDPQGTWSFVVADAPVLRPIVTAEDCGLQRTWLWEELGCDDDGDSWRYDTAAPPDTSPNDTSDTSAATP